MATDQTTKLENHQEPIIKSQCLPACERALFEQS
jgi:hypothetical protein